MKLDDTLKQLAQDAAAPVDLAELALFLAQDERPELDPQPYLDQLDTWGEKVAQERRGSLEGQVALLTEFLFEELGFTGNIQNYYDPENSYLDRVIDRRLGLPITLSLIAMAVGERAGLQVVGIGLPGHFLTMAKNETDQILFDPFHRGQMLDRPACESLISSVLGHPFQLTDAALEPVPPGWFVQRLLTNLKGAYLRRGDYLRAVRVTRRLIQLSPQDWQQHRDLGVCLVRGGKPGEAIEFLRNYLDRCPQAADRAVVAQMLNQALREIAQWN